MTRPIVLTDVSCPYCGARAGASCSTLTRGERRAVVHVLRRKAFREASK